MLFWVHAAVAYLVYRGIFGGPTDRCDDVPIIALFGGALLPDLVDKPLAFVLPSLPSRSVAHSVFAAALVVLIVFYVTKHRDRWEVGAAYALGYGSHLAADLVDYLFVPEETLLFLFWPVVTDYHHVETIGDLLALLSPTPYVLGQTVVTVLGLWLWIADGMPGYPSTHRQ
ncbi:metal-dependent hydrolase [Natrinema salsiterrestre]|uniref:Metal-dependent hydrolase n=1 Tax=Natrinema salsiterrestre TaxID=2950540 RepID=A0A9Q4L5Q4_9EURY|nr:metal-dependent hydrolase [Natrinema salsiterrestre]MDF9748117.1 metal-dependent hydrolase [Natrinema salsiterrestre]